MLVLYYFVTNPIRSMNIQTFFHPPCQLVRLQAHSRSAAMNLALSSPENMS